LCKGKIKRGGAWKESHQRRELDPRSGRGGDKGKAVSGRRSSFCTNIPGLGERRPWPAGKKEKTK